MEQEIGVIKIYTKTIKYGKIFIMHYIVNKTCYITFIDKLVLYGGIIMIYTLQGLRALAMLGIFLFHSGLLLNGTFPVTFFFILSGFVLYYTKSNTVDNMDFKQNIRWVFLKMRPFYIIHVITFLFSMIIRWEWINNMETSILFKRIIIDLLLIQSFFKENVFIFNGLAWFLSVIFILYLVAIPIIKLIKRIKLNKLIIFMCLILITQYILNLINIINRGDLYLYSNPLYRLLDFCLGMIVAKMFLENKFEIKDYNRYEIGIVITFILMYLISFFIDTGCSYYSALFIIALYIFSYQKGCISKLLKCRVLQNLAKISFEFYMIHELILILFRRVFSNLNYNWAIKNIIICIPSLIISLIISKLISKYITQNIKCNYRSEIIERQRYEVY